MLRAFLSILAAFAMGSSDSLAQQLDAFVKNEDGKKAPKLYVLTPSDVVMLKVYQEDDLQTQARIGRDGVVTLPLLGQVKIGGRTIEEATVLITRLFDDGYLVNPQVSITVME